MGAARSLSVTIVFCCLCCSALTFAAGAFAGEKIVFDIAEAKAQWTKARSAAAGSICGTSRARSGFGLKPSPDVKESEQFREVKQNHRCVSLHLSSSEIREYKKAEYLIGYNPKYAFQIRRSIGSQDWSLDQIELGSDGANLPMARGPAPEWVQATVCEHFYVLDYKLPLERLVEKPVFRITQTQPILVDGASLVRVDFESPYPIEKRKDPKDPLWHPVQGGYLVLDPGHYWCLRSYRVQAMYSDSLSTFSRDFEYTEGRDRFPVLRRSKLTQDAKRRDGKDWFTLETNFAYDFQQSPEAFEDSAFTLSAYNLPEPYGITWKRPIPRHIWFLVAAGGAFAIALGFRYLARRSHLKTNE